MKVSIIAKIYTKGESKNAVTRALMSGIKYVDATFAIDAIIKTLRLTGWYCVTCMPGAEMLYYESGLKFENYTNECMILRIKLNTK